MSNDRCTKKKRSLIACKFSFSQLEDQKRGRGSREHENHSQKQTPEEIHFALNFLIQNLAKVIKMKSQNAKPLFLIKLVYVFLIFKIKANCMKN